jgi:hypothetical protein
LEIFDKKRLKTKNSVALLRQHMHVHRTDTKTTSQFSA